MLQRSLAISKCMFVVLAAMAHAQDAGLPPPPAQPERFFGQVQTQLAGDKLVLVVANPADVTAPQKVVVDFSGTGDTDKWFLKVQRKSYLLLEGTRSPSGQEVTLQRLVLPNAYPVSVEFFPFLSPGGEIGLKLVGQKVDGKAITKPIRARGPAIAILRWILTQRGDCWNRGRGLVGKLSSRLARAVGDILQASDDSQFLDQLQELADAEEYVEWKDKVHAVLHEVGSALKVRLRGRFLIDSRGAPSEFEITSIEGALQLASSGKPPYGFETPKSAFGYAYYGRTRGVNFWPKLSPLKVPSIRFLEEVQTSGHVAAYRFRAEDGRTTWVLADNFIVGRTLGQDWQRYCCPNTRFLSPGLRDALAELVADMKKVKKGAQATIGKIKEKLSSPASPVAGGADDGSPTGGW